MKNVSIVLRSKMEPLTKILNASVELFRQYGFKTITMDDVARRAGISKKTLYQHFANKNEVVAESINWFQGKISDKCLAALADSENAIEGMVRMMGLLDQIHRQTNPIAIMELERFFPEGFKCFKGNLMDKDVMAIRENLLSGMEQGLYRADINADFMARYRMELSMLAFYPNLLVNDRFDLYVVAHEIAEHYLYGIMTPKGEKLYQKYKEKYLKEVSKI